MAFGSGDDVRGDVVVHVAVEFSCTAISCLYFVDDEEDVMFIGISADAFEEVFIEGMDAAFALDRFYHDGADFRMGFAELDVYKRQDPAKLNEEIQKANLQTVDSASLTMDEDTLKLEFTVKAVSYTHLDVYKRQMILCSVFIES